ncbi:MAG TPA: hypothetical protein VMZ30_07910 [Pyrinomonadaceae bacterium]|nr:hypothetical protein [Pyrinomonadaceae bacterium]
MPRLPIVASVAGRYAPGSDTRRPFLFKADLDQNAITPFGLRGSSPTVRKGFNQTRANPSELRGSSPTVREGFNQTRVTPSGVRGSSPTVREGLTKLAHLIPT